MKKPADLDLYAFIISWIIFNKEYMHAINTYLCLVVFTTVEIEYN